MSEIPRAAAGSVVPKDYAFHLSPEIERRMRRCRASVRTAIKKGLAEIAASAGKGRRRAPPIGLKEPPLRFYVYEGYKIAYRLDSHKRRVTVLDLSALPVE